MLSDSALPPSRYSVTLLPIPLPPLLFVFFCFSSVSLSFYLLIFLYLCTLCVTLYIRQHLQVDPHPFLFRSPARYALCLHNKLNPSDLLLVLLFCLASRLDRSCSYRHCPKCKALYCIDHETFGPLVLMKTGLFQS